MSTKTPFFSLHSSLIVLLIAGASGCSSDTTNSNGSQQTAANSTAGNGSGGVGGNGSSGVVVNGSGGTDGIADGVSGGASGAGTTGSCDSPGDPISLASPQEAIDAMEGRWLLCSGADPLFTSGTEIGFDVAGGSAIRLLREGGALVWDRTDAGSGELVPASTIFNQQEVDLHFNDGAQASFFVNRASNPETLQVIGIADGRSIGAKYILDPTVDVAALVAANQGPTFGANFGQSCQDDSDCPDGACYHSSNGVDSICSQLCSAQTPCPRASLCIPPVAPVAGNVADASYCFLDCASPACPPNVNATCVAGFPGAGGAPVDVCIPEAAPTADAGTSPGPGVACGGFLGITCSADEYCDYQPGQLCGAGDASSTCQPRPTLCTDDYNPVCGCDAVTYGNACGAHTAGTGVFSVGECP